MTYRDFFLPREVRWSWQTFGCHSDDLELFLLERCVPIQATGCWEWTGRRLPSGYGTFCHEGRSCYAHRASQELWNGPLTPSRPHALHSCDNPPCINPEHLRAGSPKENMADRDTRGRGFHQRPEFEEIIARANSSFSDDDLVAVFAMRRAGATAAQIAPAFGVCVSTISHVLTGRTHARRTAHLRPTEAA